MTLIIVTSSLIGGSIQVAQAQTASFGSDGSMFAPNCHCPADVAPYHLATYCGNQNTCNGASDTHTVSVSDGDYHVTVNLGGLTDYQKYEVAIITINGADYTVPDQGGNGSSTGTASYDLGTIHLSGAVNVRARHKYADIFTGLWYADNYSRWGSASAVESIDVLSVVFDKIVVPKPTCTISANPATINIGNNSTLTWSTTNATSVSIDQGIGNVSTSGSKSVSPSNTTTYTETASGPGGTVSCNTKIQVNVLAPAINIIKDDNDNSDDKQTVKEKGAATFKITVTNTGDANLENVIISDAKVADCNRTASQTKSLYSTEYFEVGKKFSYTCSDSSVVASYINTAQVTATSVDNPKDLNDSDDSSVTVENTPPPDEPEKDEPKKDDKCDGSIGDYIWLDANSDGVQDGGEHGLNNITLKLKDNNGKEIDKTHTNSKGKYEFDNLCEGKYSVYVSDGDVSGYIQTFDPDGNKNNKTDVRLSGKSDSHKKADFGYNKTRTAPVTGSGTIALYLTGLISIIGLLSYKQLKQRFVNTNLV